MLSDNDLKGLPWRKSSFSASSACVEVARLGRAYVAVRDSKSPAGGVQVYSQNEWRSFVKGVRNGEFDDLDSDS